MYNILHSAWTPGPADASGLAGGELFRRKRAALPNGGRRAWSGTPAAPARSPSPRRETPDSRSHRPGSPVARRSSVQSEPSGPPRNRPVERKRQGRGGHRRRLGGRRAADRVGPTRWCRARRPPHRRRPARGPAGCEHEAAAAQPGEPRHFLSEPHEGRVVSTPTDRQQASLDRRRATVDFVSNAAVAGLDSQRHAAPDPGDERRAGAPMGRQRGDRHSPPRPAQGSVRRRPSCRRWSRGASPPRAHPRRPGRRDRPRRRRR